MSEDAATSQAWRQSMRVDWGFFWWHVRLMLWYVVGWGWSEYVITVCLVENEHALAFWMRLILTCCCCLLMRADAVMSSRYPTPFFWDSWRDVFCIPHRSESSLMQAWKHVRNSYSFILSSMLSLVPTCGVRCVPFPMSSKDSPVLPASTSFYSWDVWKSCDDVEN